MHISVLLKEVIEGLSLKSNDIVLDGTINGGGHSLSIAKLLGEDGLLIGLDLDLSALSVAKERLMGVLPRVELFQSNFRDLASVLDGLGIKMINKALFDFGLSSRQLSFSGRGFTFEKDEPLLMTFKENPNENELTAEIFVNQSSEDALADIIFAYGNERYARRIAKGIVEARKNAPIKTTNKLVEIILTAVPKAYLKGRIHPATKTFQALRMAVNDELGAIKQGLSSAFDRLSSGGRIATISFHSLEDKIVKEFIKEKKALGLAESLYKKPLIAGSQELKENPRARSAKLRIIIKK